MTSSICLFYITTMKLNKYIKIILCSLALVNITTILLSIISNVLMILFSQTTFFTCLILNQVTYVIVYENISAVSLISVLRYTMAYHASRFKITSTRYILLAITMAFSVPIFVLVVNGIVTSTSGTYMEMCLGYKVLEKYHMYLKNTTCIWKIPHTLGFLSKITIELKMSWINLPQICKNSKSQKELGKLVTSIFFKPLFLAFKGLQNSI